MEVLTVTKNGELKKQICHSPPIEQPVEIKFVIEEKDYITFMNAIDYYKWSAYDALSMFCGFADILISTMDTDDRFRSDDEILDEFK
jgi:hypothetical protein